MNITVKNGSSIWQLATVWGNGQLPENFCDMFWKTLWVLFCISVGCICAGAYLGFLLAGVAASFSMGYLIWTTPLIWLVGIVVFISVSVFLIIADEKASDTMTENPTGALSNAVNAYSAWKNKYCPQVIEK